MDNQELRKVREAIGVSDFKLGYKSGVHLSVIEAFFAGKTEELTDRERRLLSETLEKLAKKAK